MIKRDIFLAYKLPKSSTGLQKRAMLLGSEGNCSPVGNLGQGGYTAGLKKVRSGRSRGGIQTTVRSKRCHSEKEKDFVQTILRLCRHKPSASHRPDRPIGRKAEAYKGTHRNFKLTILRSKRKSFKELCSEMKVNPWQASC